MLTLLVLHFSRRRRRRRRRVRTIQTRGGGRGRGGRRRQQQQRERGGIGKQLEVRCQQKSSATIQSRNNYNSDDDDDDENRKKKKKTSVGDFRSNVGGKSSVAISIAETRQRRNSLRRLGASVSKLERRFAKLSKEDMQSIRHHMLDLKSPVTEDFDVGEFYELANGYIDDIHARGKVPDRVRKGPMYVKWLTGGKPNVPKSTKESSLRAEKEVREIRDRYSNTSRNNDDDDDDDDDVNKAQAWDEAIEYLKQRGDSETAGKLARNDWYRLTRALEILDVSGGKPKGSFQPVKDESKQFHCYALSMNRVDLYRRMDQRVEEMVANGILDEAAYLLREGVKPNTNSASRAIGYAQAIDYLLKCKREKENNSESSINDDATLLLEFIDELQRETRCTLKRQFTWLRSEKQFQWIDASEGAEIASSRIFEKFNNAQSDVDDEGEEINESNNNSSICEVTKEMANELKRTRQLKLFHDESIRKATVERVADIVSRM